jgi:dephospho-CoA kinase
MLTALVKTAAGSYSMTRRWRGNPPLPERNPLPETKPQSKPVIGLAGGIGSGKSAVARQMGSLGGFVIDADALAKQALQRAEVIEQLVAWWGEGMLDAEGQADRAKIAQRVFENPEERKRLEGLIHPLVAEQRAKLIQAAGADPAVRFIVLDVPLLFEVGLDRECDRVVFVEADEATRLKRVGEQRGWGPEELARRERNQMPLDRKRSQAHDMIRNDRSEGQSLAQVRELLARLLPDQR